MTHGAYALLYSPSREPLLLQASFPRAARHLLIPCGHFATNDLCASVSLHSPLSGVLREAFDYSYGQIAEILQMEETNTHQFVSRGATGERASLAA